MTSETAARMARVAVIALVPLLIAEAPDSATDREQAKRSLHHARLTSPDYLRDYVRKASPYDRNQTARDLSGIGPAALPAALALLDDADLAVRTVGLMAASDIAREAQARGYAKDVAPLLKQHAAAVRRILAEAEKLRDKEPVMIGYAQALAKAAALDPAAEAASTALSAADQDTRVAAVQQLARTNPAGADAVLEKAAAADASPAVRHAARVALLQLKGPRQRERLIEAMRTGDDKLRTEAMRVIPLTEESGWMLLLEAGAGLTPEQIARVVPAYAANQHAFAAAMKVILSGDARLRPPAVSLLSRAYGSAERDRPQSKETEDVAASVAAMLEDRSEGVRQMAVDALARMLPASAPATLKALASPKLEVRRAAAAALRPDPGNASAWPNVPQEALPALLAAMKDPDTGVRADVASALGRVGRAGLPALTAALDDADPDVRSEALNGLVQSAVRSAPDPASPRGRRPGAVTEADREAAMRALIAATKHRNPYVRREALATIGRWGLTPWAAKLEPGDPQFKASPRPALPAGEKAAMPPPRPMAELVAALKDPQESRREKVWMCEELRRHGPAAAGAAVPALIRTFKEDKDAALRAAAAEALGAVGAGAPGAATDALVSGLGDKDRRVVVAAVSALGKMGPGAAGAAPRLRQIASGTDQDLSTSATRALAGMGPAAAPVLGELLVSGDGVGSFVAAESLERMGPAAAGALPQMLKALRREQAAVMAEQIIRAIGALGAAGKPAVADLVAVVKDSKSYPLRTAAIKALGAIGPAAAGPESIGALTAAMRNRDTQSQAVNALARFGPAGKAAVPALTEALRGALEAARRDRQRGMSVSGFGENSMGLESARALGRMGPAAKEALPLMREAMAVMGGGTRQQRLMKLSIQRVEGGIAADGPDPAPPPPDPPPVEGPADFRR
jgi:HEAT repeat protein